MAKQEETALNILWRQIILTWQQSTNGKLVVSLGRWDS